ncbi:polysaccharide biosynthesis/export family protein [Sphingosinicella sp. BN140058]|uniref:polysaccharide biosynthesis/export family protein n=1 Tax=Sphingosinicella sp. BN140058 TaxID=1892855 RepID=UPI001011780E|nr:polysaccharide biosynthesis/export family protein [Sphingosinicella sp. BN140058]QAY77055.1 polysaccharide export protein [Sphingosinicella sp. BN140058]
MSIFDDAPLAGTPRCNASAAGALRRLVLASVLATCLAGCAGTRGGNLPYHPSEEAFGEPDSQALAALESNYRISPLDKLKINVFQVADLSGDYEVDLTGNIAMPLVGNVRAVDLTTDQLDAKLTQVLGEKYLQSPDVSVGVVSSSTRVVTVDGAVRDPGMYPVNGRITLIQVIARAKGTADDANPRRVAIFRQIDGQRMAAAFDLTDIRRGKVEDPRVYSGDIVVVDGSSVRAAQRELLTALPVVGFFNSFAF